MRSEAPLSPHSLRTPEFEEWCAGTRVLDAQGAPLAVYRGFRRTPKSDRFVLTRGRATASFTDDPLVASVYSRQLPGWGQGKSGAKYGSGSTVMPAYLSIAKPLDIRHLGPQVTLGDVVNLLPWDWSVKYGLRQSLNNPKFGAFDLVDALSDMDEMASQTLAHFKIDASDDDYWRIRDFDELRDYIAQKATSISQGDEDACWAIENALSDVEIDAFMIADSPRWVQALQRLGYDGVFHRDIFDVGAQYYEGDIKSLTGEDEVISYETFRPFSINQVKSVFNDRPSKEFDDVRCDFVNSSQEVEMETSRFPRQRG